LLRWTYFFYISFVVLAASFFIGFTASASVDSANRLLRASKTRYKPIKKILRPGDRLNINGFKGKLILRERTISQKNPQTAEKSITFKFEKTESSPSALWSPLVSRSGSILTVGLHLKDGSNVAEGARKNDKPRFNLEIVASALPTSIIWDQGDILVKNWSESLSITSNQGNINIEKSTNPLKIQLLRGLVGITNHSGDVSVQLHTGRFSSFHTKGAMDIESLKGKFQVKNHLGPLNLFNHSGQVDVSDCNGELRYWQIQGGFVAKNHQGSVYGWSEGVDVILDGVSAPKVDIQAGQGKTTLALKRFKNNSIRALTKKGRLKSRWGMSSFQKGRWRGLKRGLAGDGQSEVKIVSQRGDIVFK